MAEHILDLTTPYDTSSVPAAADVVIIGGGVMGISTAWHLAESGVKNIVVVEKGELGEGSSAKPLGGLRANFSDPGNIILGQRSLEAYKRIPNVFRRGIGLHEVGYLFLARNEGSLAALDQATATQNDLGVNSRMVTASDAQQLNPFLDPQALTGAAFSPADGYAEPALAIKAYADAAAELGVTILTQTQVQHIERTGSTIEAVVTHRGRIRTSAVVCAAGAWSAEIGRMVDVDLPVVPVRRQIGFTRQQPQAHPIVPFTLDLETTLYFHNYRNALLVGISHTQEPGFDRNFDYSWLPEFNAAAHVCVPSIENPDLVGGWAGLYENTPDHNAIIGEADELPGFFYATGFSGHGFLQGPAVGELVTDLYLGRPSFMDHTQFSVNRFSTAQLVMREVHII
ncbi:NAD(P)/FAD-dependent oxidoreductase [Leucobacter sp. GX24907]